LFYEFNRGERAVNRMFYALNMYRLLGADRERGREVGRNSRKYRKKERKKEFRIQSTHPREAHMTRVIMKLLALSSVYRGHY